MDLPITKLPTACSHCQSSALYYKRIRAGQLVDASVGGKFFDPAELYMVACADCGELRFILEEKVRQGLPEGSDWRHIKKKVL